MIPADTLIVTLGLILLMAGIALTFAALRGRMLNTHPHCRACTFDLIGLDIDQPTPCPECGRTVRRGTGSVRIGRRQRRRVLLAVGVVMLLGGATGLAWPKLAQIPSIRNFDWYAHFPESLLLRLEAGGDKDALAELHSRLTPGTLSDEGLGKLSDRSLAMLDDESVPWDERWGDVLLYAFLFEKLEEHEAIEYIERSIRFDLKVHQQVGFETTSVQYTLIELEPDRGAWSPSFLNPLAQVLPASRFGRPVTGYQMEYAAFRPYQIGDDQRGGSFRANVFDPESEGYWLPYEQHGSSTGTRLDLDPAQEQFSFVYPIQITIYKDGTIHQQWTIEKRFTIERVQNPQYLQPFSDQHILAEVAESLLMSAISVPVDPQSAKEYKDLTRGSSPIAHLEGSIEYELGLLGTLMLDNGAEQIELNKVMIPQLRASRYGMMTPEPWQFARNWLDYYIAHESFWEIARERGVVDVIYIPDLSLGIDDARYEQVIDQRMIWRNVPIDLQEVRPMNYTNGDGITREGVALQSTSQPRVGESITLDEMNTRRELLQPVAGALFEDD